MDNEGNNKKILQNSMYEQECSMVFTDSALWANSVVELPCPSVCVPVPLRHLSHVTCPMIFIHNIFFLIKKLRLIDEMHF